MLARPVALKEVRRGRRGAPKFLKDDQTQTRFASVSLQAPNFDLPIGSLEQTHIDPPDVLRCFPCKGPAVRAGWSISLLFATSGQRLNMSLVERSFATQRQAPTARCTKPARGTRTGVPGWSLLKTGFGTFQSWLKRPHSWLVSIFCWT